MKTFVRSLCVAGLLLGGVAVSRADDSAATKKEAAPAAGAQQLTPEQRAAKRKELQAKFEAQLKELRAKKAAGTLTEAETKRLEGLEKREARQKQQAEAKAKADAAPHKAETK
jgi:hypothetical protein